MDLEREIRGLRRQLRLSQAVAAVLFCCLALVGLAPLQRSVLVSSPDGKQRVTVRPDGIWVENENGRQIGLVNAADGVPAVVIKGMRAPGSTDATLSAGKNGGKLQLWAGECSFWTVDDNESWSVGPALDFIAEQGDDPAVEKDK